MARVRAARNTVLRNNATEFLVNLPEHQTDDWLLVIVVKDDAVSGANATPAGWTAGTEGSVGSGADSIRTNYYYKKATSSSEADPIITNPDSDTWAGVALSIQGADPTTFIDIASSPTTQLATNPYVAPSVTTTTNNCLLIRVCTGDGGVAQVVEPGFVTLGVVDGTGEAICVAYDVQVTAGVTPTCDFYSETNSDESILYTIAIRDGSSGAIMPGHVNSDVATLIRTFSSSATMTGDVLDTNSNAITQLAGAWQDPLTVYQVDNSPLTFVDITTAATNSTTNDAIPFPAAEAGSDYCAIGFGSAFRSLRFDRAGSTVGVGASYAYDYLSTSGTWKVLFNVRDATAGFTSAAGDYQVISWTVPSDWSSQSLNGVSRFWVRIRLGGSYTTNPTFDRVYVNTSFSLQHQTLSTRTNAGINPAYNSMNLASNISGNIFQGGTYSPASSLNLSTARILGTTLLDSPADIFDTSGKDEGGAILGFVDGTSKVKLWSVFSSDALDVSPNKRNPFLIQINQSTDTSFVSSSPTMSAITKLLLAVNCKFAACQISYTSLFNVGTLKVNGGGATTPVDYLELVKIANGVHCPMIDSITNTAYVLIQIGGDRPVNFQASSFTLNFPTCASVGKYVSFHSDPNIVGIAIDARAGDVCKITSAKFIGGSSFVFNVLSTASASATYDFAGLVVENASVTLRAVTTFTSMSFANCGSFTSVGASMASCSFTNTKVVGSAGTTITNSSFTKGTDTYALEFTNAGSYNISSTTFTGYTTVLNVSATTGTVTITLALGQAEPSYITAGATVTFTRPAVYFNGPSYADDTRYQLTRQQIFNVASAAINTATDAITLGNDTSGLASALSIATSGYHTLVKIDLAAGATMPTSSPQIVSGGTYRVKTNAAGVITLCVSEGGATINFTTAGTNNGSGQLFTITTETNIANGVVSGGAGLSTAIVAPNNSRIRRRAIHYKEVSGATVTSIFFDDVFLWSDTANTNDAAVINNSSNPWAVPNLVGTLTSVVLPIEVVNENGTAFTEVTPQNAGSTVTGLSLALEGIGKIQINSADSDGLVVAYDLAVWFPYILSTAAGIWVCASDTLTFTDLFNYTARRMEIDETSGTFTQFVGANIAGMRVSSSTTGNVALNVATRGNGATVETAGLTATVAEAVRVEMDANSTKLDVAVSTRLATASYTTPPTVEAISDGVWDEVLTGATHNIATSAGRRLRQLGTTLAAEGSLTGTPTSTVLPTNLTEATSDFYKDQTFRMTSGALTGQAVPILSYNGATKTITLSEALTSTPNSGETFEIDSNHIHPISQIQNGLALEATSQQIKSKTKLIPALL